MASFPLFLPSFLSFSASRTSILSITVHLPARALYLIRLCTRQPFTRRSQTWFSWISFRTSSLVTREQVCAPAILYSFVRSFSLFVGSLYSLTLSLSLSSTLIAELLDSHITIKQVSRILKMNFSYHPLFGILKIGWIFSQEVSHKSKAALAKKNQKRETACPEDSSSHDHVIPYTVHHNKENRVLRFQDIAESCYLDLDQKTSSNLATTMDSPESRAGCFGQINGKSHFTLSHVTADYAGFL